MVVYNSIIQLWFSNVLSTLCLFFLLLMTLAIYIHRTYYKHSERFMELANKIPGSTSYPFIGSAYVFGTDPKGILKNLSNILDKYDNVSKIWVGPMLYVCVKEAKDVEALLSTNTLLKKSLAYSLMKPAIGNGLLISPEEIWKKHRKTLRPTFSYEILENYVDVFNDKVKTLTEVLETQVEKHDIDIFPFLLNFVYDIIWGTMLTTEINGQQTDKYGEEAKFPSAVNSGVSIIVSRMFKPWLYSDFMFKLTPGGRKYHSYLSLVQSSIKQVILNKIQDMNSSHNENEHTDEKTDTKRTVGFLDFILEHAVEKEFSDQDIFDETANIIITGLDTATSTFGLIIAILSRRFDVQELIVEEIMHVLGSLEEKPVSYDDLHNFTYLDRVIKECLRLLPTIPYIARETSKEINLPSGYTIPNGCSVLIPFFRLHRDPNHYENPNVFDPDNFLPEKVAARSSYSFRPFSAGPRDCIAKKYAMLELRVGILSLLRRFWITPTNVKLELEGKLNLNPCKGVHVGLKKRTVERPLLSGMENLSKKIQTNIDSLNIHFKDSYR